MVDASRTYPPFDIIFSGGELSYGLHYQVFGISYVGHYALASIAAQRLSSPSCGSCRLAHVGCIEGLGVMRTYLRPASLFGFTISIRSLILTQELQP